MERERSREQQGQGGDRAISDTHSLGIPPGVHDRLCEPSGDVWSGLERNVTAIGNKDTNHIGVG